MRAGAEDSGCQHVEWERKFERFPDGRWTGMWWNECLECGALSDFHWKPAENRIIRFMGSGDSGTTEV
jgi:hypothetical protein